MTYDRQITISAGNSRKDTRWKQQVLTVSELYDKLRTPSRGAETLAKYMAMGKAEQDTLKDVGGFVAGALNGPRRKASAVIGRDIITLDFDSVPPLYTDRLAESLDATGCGYCIYSTRKHAPNAPRLRVLVPTDRTMTPDEYEPCARRVAEYIGIGMADPTTFEVSRLMYWPSCCADSEYYFRTVDAPLMRVDDLLATYTDWRDIASWPQVPGSFNYQKLAVKQGDPESKPGLVGAFCRVYDVYRAIDELLPGIYAPCDTKDRYTYLGGSTTGGAVVYDNGKFLFSHHATDPCSGRLVNAFDLVRLHRFADEDDRADAGTPINRLPSFVKMAELADSLDEVKLLLLKERRDSALADFQGLVINTAITPPPAPADDQSGIDPDNWMLKLQTNSKGGFAGTIDNVRIILENDPLLKDRFALNQFSGRGEVLGVLPWSIGGEEKKRRMWSDTDSNGLYWYMEKAYRITGRGNIDAALDIHTATHAFNDVKDYLMSREWDGMPRLDTLLIDYLGAEDTPYTRAVTRKTFTAAVARAMEPGCKYDYMTVLCGPQGIGKSTLIDKMSLGFYNDSIRTFEGKEASELLQRVWLVEVAEIDQFKQYDVARIKQFLSLRADRYRAAYGRNVKEIPRSCVFFGTCNTLDFLQDTTGNRRFWPVDTATRPVVKDVFTELDGEINQVWAEAVVRWRLGEELFLSGDVEAAAQELQEAHREALPQEGIIADFAEKLVPDDWQTWTVDRRRDYWAGAIAGDAKERYTLVERDRITALEVWCELYGKNRGDCKKSDSRSINAVLAHLPGWTADSGRTARFGPYGVQKGFFKKSALATLRAGQG